MLMRSSMTSKGLVQHMCTLDKGGSHKYGLQKGEQIGGCTSAIPPSQQTTVSTKHTRHTTCSMSWAWSPLMSLSTSLSRTMGPHPAVGWAQCRVLSSQIGRVCMIPMHEHPPMCPPTQGRMSGKADDTDTASVAMPEEGWRRTFYGEADLTCAVAADHLHACPCDLTGLPAPCTRDARASSPTGASRPWALSLIHI